MRVISEDKKIDVDYNNTAFYVVEDDGKYCVVTRSIDFRLYAPMTNGSDEQTAIQKLTDIRDAFLAGRRVFYL